MTKRWSDCLTKEHQLRGKTKKSPRTNAVRSHCGLHSHMSGAERDCCLYFQMLEKVGYLKILKVQPNVLLTDAKIRVIPDWLLEFKDGSQRYADMKGFETQSWGRNKRLWKFYGPLPMEVWKKKGDVFYISETIVPVKELTK